MALLLPLFIDVIDVISDNDGVRDRFRRICVEVVLPSRDEGSVVAGIERIGFGGMREVEDELDDRDVDVDGFVICIAAPS